MAAGSVTVAALRHRPRQAMLVVALAAVVTGAAALGPLYARAVEQSVVRNVVQDAPPASSTLVVTDRSDPPAAPARAGPHRPRGGATAVRGTDRWRRGAAAAGPGWCRRAGADPVDQPGRHLPARQAERRPLPPGGG